MDKPLKLTKREKIINAIAKDGKVFVFMNKGILSHDGKETVIGDSLFWQLVREKIIVETHRVGPGNQRWGWKENKEKALKILSDG